MNVFFAFLKTNLNTQNRHTFAFSKTFFKAYRVTSDKLYLPIILVGLTPIAPKHAIVTRNNLEACFENVSKLLAFWECR